MEPSDVELEEDPQHLVDILSRVMALLPLLLFVCFFFSSSSSSATILPAPVMLVFHWSMPRCLRKGTEGEELKCKLNC